MLITKTGSIMHTKNMVIPIMSAITRRSANFTYAALSALRCS
jgi:hypothetical protein